MPTALFLSPHLDDVAFSCAGTLLRLQGAGWQTPLVTVFTATVPNPEGFALRCQTDKQIAPEVDYMALRRAEDDHFAQVAGITEAMHWNFPEAPHRGYDSALDLFAGIHPGDDLWESIAEHLWDIADKYKPDIVFAPQGLGSHVDHLQVIRAVQSAELEEITAWYRDTPYALREPDAEPSDLLPAGLVEVAVSLEPNVLDRKIDGACAYASQIGFQFGGADEVRRQLTEFHALEAERAGMDGYAEYLLAPHDIREILEELFA